MLLYLPTQVFAVGGDFTLTAHTGKTYSLQQARGKVVIMAFGYTYCPDICPTALASITSAIDGLGNASTDVQPIFISLDPDRDTPQRLKDYVGYFDPGMIGLTGTSGTLAEVAARYHAKYAFVGKGKIPNYSMDHSAILYLMDRQGQLARILPHNTPPKAIMQAITELQAQTE